MTNGLKQKRPTVSSKSLSEPDRIRTCDRLLRREVLYPAELRARNSKIVGVAGFEPATSASQTRRDNRATLHPEFWLSKKLRRDRDSNPGDSYPSTD